MFNLRRYYEKHLFIFIFNVLFRFRFCSGGGSKFASTSRRLFVPGFASNSRFWWTKHSSKDFYDHPSNCCKHESNYPQPIYLVETWGSESMGSSTSRANRRRSRNRSRRAANNTGERFCLRRSRGRSRYTS